MLIGGTVDEVDILDIVLHEIPVLEVLRENDGIEVARRIWWIIDAIWKWRFQRSQQRIVSQSTLEGMCPGNSSEIFSVS